MIGIAFVAVMMLIGPGVAMLLQGEPDYPPEPTPAEYFGPARRLFELSRAW